MNIYDQEQKVVEIDMIQSTCINEKNSSYTCVGQKATCSFTEDGPLI